MMGRSVMLIGLSDRGQRSWQNSHVSKKSNFMKALLLIMVSDGQLGGQTTNEMK